MRLFTAIDIPDAIASKLGAVIDRLRPKAKLSWTSVEKMHITMKFIGEWPEDRLDEMKRSLAGVRATGGIEITVRGLGWYPNPRDPHVFWAGVEAGDDLRSLAKATDQAVHAIGVPLDSREYSPHLTLARIRKRVYMGALTKEAEKLERTDFGSFRATDFYLYLSRAGAYTKLAGFALV